MSNDLSVNSLVMLWLKASSPFRFW